MFNKDNIIIFAAGGGNDVFSAIAYIESYLSKYKFNKIALVSVLGFTPFHSNTEIKYDTINTEAPLIKPTNTFHRYIQTLNPKEINNTEKFLDEIINENTQLIYDYVCMSPKYCSTIQAINLNKLFIEWDMLPDSTLLHIVDFGGDILTNGLQSSIISPELDAYTLSVVRELCGNYKYVGNISVCFPGIDGELNADYLNDCCENKSMEIDNFDKDIMHNKLVKIYAKLINTRPGNTIPNMIRILETTDNNNMVNIQTNKHWIINKEKVSVNLHTQINLNLQYNIYIFDLQIDNPFANLFNVIPYNLTDVITSIVNIYKLQNISNNTVQSSDLFLQYLRLDTDGYFTNKHLICNGNPKVMFVDVYPYIIANKSTDIVNNDLYNMVFSKS